MTLSHRFLLFLNKLSCLFSILAYLSVFVPPAVFWPAGILTLFVPVMLVMHLLFFAYWISRRGKQARKALYSAVFLVLGYPFLRATAALPLGSAPPQGSQVFTATTFNVRVFNAYQDPKGKNGMASGMTAWVKQHPTDIWCFQEFYNQDTSRVFSMTRQLIRGGFKAHVVPSVVDRSGAEFGLAIFSQFPIVKKGRVVFGEKSLNQAIYADLDTGQDTLRVINIHLESMHLDSEQIVDMKNFQESSTALIRRLKRGMIMRSSQVEALEKYISTSPYPVLLCGDLNDMPYSYTYQRLRSLLGSAFETAGSGFGFTYNGPLFFLRIDGQFHSRRLNPHSFRTHRESKHSDHFPVSCRYWLSPKQGP